MLHSLGSFYAAIPSPSSGAIHLGKIQLRAYGMMIALGALAAVWLGGRRLEKAGTGHREDMSAIAMWALPAGVVGARIYHVVTDWKTFRGDWLRAFKIWQGGLGIWGGIALGTVVGLWAARRRGLNTADVLRATTPALPLAQAIGRWGNWWNQELFGRPTTVPWALKIDQAHRPERYADVATFHPTFLYESLWNLALCGALIWIDRKYKPRAGRLFALYVAGYTFLRFFLERLRVDPAFKVAGLRVNEWVSVIVFVGAVAFIVLGPKGEPAVAADGDAPLDDGVAAAEAVDLGGDEETTAALGTYAFDGSFDDAPAAPPEPDPNADPEVSAALGTYAFDSGFASELDAPATAEEPEPAAAEPDGDPADVWTPQPEPDPER